MEIQCHLHVQPKYHGQQFQQQKVHKTRHIMIMTFIAITRLKYSKTTVNPDVASDVTPNTSVCLPGYFQLITQAAKILVGSDLNANVHYTWYFRVYYQYGQFELYLLTNNWKYFLLTTERLTCVTVNNLLWNEFLYLAAILWLCKPFTLHLLCCLCLQTVLGWVRTIYSCVRHQSSFPNFKICQIHWIWWIYVGCA